MKYQHHLIAALLFVSLGISSYIPSASSQPGLSLGLTDPNAATSLSTAAAQVEALELVRQSPFVAADGSLDLELRWTGATTEGLSISTIIWAPINDESDVYIEPSLVRNRVAAQELSGLSQVDNGILQYSIPIRSFTAPEDDQRTWLQDSGVYPITIEIRGETGVLARLRTNLIRLPTDIAEIPLFPISPVLRVTSADGLDLNDAIKLLNAHPTLPLTVVLEGGLLPQLSSNPELATAFAEALGDRKVVAGTQLSLDPSALAAIGQPDFYSQALADTRRQFAEIGLMLDQEVIPLRTGITEEGAELLIAAGVKIVIDLQPATGSRGTLTQDNGSLTIVRIDDEHIAGLRVSDSVAQRASNSVKRAHQLLALLAVRYQKDRSPVILGGGGLSSVNLQALEVVLDALDQGGMMKADTMEDAALSSRTLPFRPQENPDQNLSDIVEPLQSVQEVLAIYADFRVAGGPSPEGIQIRILEGLSRNLNPEARRARMASIEADLIDELDVISLPKGPAITLAAQTTAIPITITNTSSGVRRVKLSFQSDRIRVAEHDQEILIQPGVSQIDINIEARSLGLSSLLVTVLTVDESRELARTRFAIRSTAIPGLGYAISGAALVFLIIWWLRSIRRSRDLARHPANTEASELDSPDPDDTHEDATDLDNTTELDTTGSCESNIDKSPSNNDSAKQARTEVTSDRGKGNTTLSS